MKKITSLVLIISLLTSLVVPCGAANSTNQTSDLQTEIASEFQRRYDATMQSVYEQLQEQDALVLMSVYDELVRADIEASIMKEYGISTWTAGEQLTAPNGGVVHYFSKVSDGIKNTEVTVTYMAHEAGLKAHEKRTEFTFDDVVKEVLGLLPWDKIITPTTYEEQAEETERVIHLPISKFEFEFVSALVAGLLSMQSISGGMREDDIVKNQYVSRAIHTFNAEYNTAAHVVLAWENYPYITKIGTEIKYECAIAN